MAVLGSLSVTKMRVGTFARESGRGFFEREEEGEEHVRESEKVKMKKKEKRRERQKKNEP